MFWPILYNNGKLSKQYPFNIFNKFPFLLSQFQIITDKSSAEEANNLLDNNTILPILALCPLKILIGLRLFKFHILIKWSTSCPYPVAKVSFLIVK